MKTALYIFLLISSTMVWADNGLISLKSNHSVDETRTNLVNALKSKGMTVFKVIDHQKGGQSVDIELRPTTVVIFGNPKVGTPLMQCAQTVAIDLPQKALIWEDADGQVWYSYNDPQYMVKRHNIQGCERPLNKITHALANFAKAATK